MLTVLKDFYTLSCGFDVLFVVVVIELSYFNCVAGVSRLCILCAFRKKTFKLNHIILSVFVVNKIK